MEEDARLEATEPYIVAELQAEFVGHSLREVYTTICDRLRLTPLTSVAVMFPDVADAWDAVTMLDFSRTYVGSQGALPVIELCRRLPRLQSLTFYDNYLSNNTVWYLAQMALYHPGLERVDLSANEYISWSGAMCLVELVLRNPHIVYVGLRGSTVSAEIVASIEAQTRKNAVSRFRNEDLKRLPPVHPVAMYIRALKHQFAMHQQDGLVSASLLDSGFEELLRVSGRTGELHLFTDKYFSKLKARASPGSLTCEAFLLLLLIEGSTYDETTVEKLKHVFTMFNMDPSVPDPIKDGYVLGRDMADIMTHMYGSRPSDVDVAALQCRLGATAEATTLSWEEFLYIAYPHGPQVGDRLWGMMCTPLSNPIEIMHC
ncbi:hypothetical protein LPMP_204380 [Leishmania panamensis]|uniref:Leucine-rich repeat protein n=1 Tax=Leishmania panamensis TaxID=5679 RepID=A0A088RPA5_LEIPA|nr:hypothetical protein LPMP_204380 [Leishmania panamensis]AIN97932.1 hypothetical protein LPMP_204380 [Leishmania panamensis]